MANQACVAIGINRYQFLPPLNYGQADAQALWQFLVEQAKWPSQMCLLLTDTAPMLGNQSTYPTRENILSWLEAERQNSSPSVNWRWFFFSGYGVSWEQTDYLMPIDGNLDDIPGTGIPVRSLFASLKNSGSENILVLLDINRSPVLQTEEPVGARTVELARQMGIAVVLSTQLDQCSHEAAALGKGLFTEALLEALRYFHSDTTLEKLDQYLRDRLPELSQHHWRPIQTPLTVIPTDAARQQLILPTAENLLVQAKTPVGTAVTSPRTSVDAEDSQVEYSRNGTRAPVGKTVVLPVEERPDTSLTSVNSATSNQTPSQVMAMIPYPNKHSDFYTPQKPLWQQLLLWGGGAVLALVLMIAAVVLRNREAFVGKQARQTPVANLSSTTSSGITKSQQPVASLPMSVQSRREANQATLDKAKRLIRYNHVSLFNKAIVQARDIKPGDPLYQQARQNITRWSEVILDIAEGRAEKGNYATAIPAAQLVPKDDPSVYAKAQKTIEQWQVLSTQQKENQGIIQAAKQQIQYNQGSSYIRAIAAVRKIPSGQPGYAEAQQLIEQWSQTIYQMAQSRASQGKFQMAIQTAALVPAGTPSYDDAQKVIAKWRQKKQ
jgi:hypothetical protein